MGLCLGLEGTPVFAPPLEMGFQGVIENFNGLWQKKVWGRFHHENLPALSQTAGRFASAYRKHLARTHHRHASRRPFPKELVLDWQKPPSGLVIYLRRTDEQGRVKILGHCFVVEALWQHRLVRCEIDLDKHQIRFLRLRRRKRKKRIWCLSRSISQRTRRCCQSASTTKQWPKILTLPCSSVRRR